MVTIQHVIISNKVEPENTAAMYYRAEKPIFQEQDGKYWLEKGVKYDFFTFYNALPVSQWKKYTHIGKINLVLDIQGKLRLRLLGKFSVNEANFEEVLGRYYINNKEREIVKIPIPDEIRSSLVGFDIIAEKNTYLYGAYFEADTEDVYLRSPQVALIQTNCADADDGKEDKVAISTLSDTYELDRYYCTEIRPDDLHRYAGKYTHAFIIDCGTSYLNEIFFRLITLLSAEKKQYYDADVCGLPLSIERPSVLEILVKNIRGGKASKNKKRFELNELDHVVTCSNYFLNQEAMEHAREDWGFICVPLLNHRNSEVVVLNGMAAWMEVTSAEIAKNLCRIQNLLLYSNQVDDSTKEMYYRGNTDIIENEEGYIILRPDYFDFSTYFNSLSLGKWEHYTRAKEYSLELDVKGSFMLELMGHSVGKDNQIKKQWLGRHQYNLPNKTHISLVIPAKSSDVIAFQISVYEETTVYDGYYAAVCELEELEKPFISLVTTTFKKEQYVHKNIELLNNSIFADEQMADQFIWNIIDNGSTLSSEELSSDHIHIFPNKNVGGAGGFSRGMLESFELEKKPTHVLLMDDDVNFLPESFYRLYYLLYLLKPQFKNYFISGAMLEINARNIQHEDVGMFRLNGEHGPAKPRYDLNKWDSVIYNEQILQEDSHQYSGWWYCCIPATVARSDNLPLPFFIRGDDVEYSIRNQAKFITMNGICIWHEGFGTKFSGAMELYQVHRNDLILQAVHPEMQDVKVIDRIKELFWQELYKFNYKGCDLLLDAVEDFLKGPSYIETLNGEECMVLHRQKDNELKPITDAVRAQIDYASLYEYTPLTGLSKTIYDYTCNGQRWITFISKKNKCGIIPYGWGYYQSKMNLINTIYAIDPINDLYVEYHKDIGRFRELKLRYEFLIEAFDTNYETIKSEYQEAEKKIESEPFWQDYLGV